MNIPDDSHLRFLFDRFGDPRYAEVFVQLYDLEGHLQLVDQLLADNLEPALYWPCVLGVLDAARFPGRAGMPEWRNWPTARLKEIAARLVRVIHEKLDREARESLEIAASLLLLPGWACFNPLAVEVLSALASSLVHEDSGKTERFSLDLSAHYGLVCPELLTKEVSYEVPTFPELLGTCQQNHPCPVSISLEARSIASLATKHDLDPDSLAFVVSLHLFVQLMHQRVAAQLPSLASAGGILSRLVRGRDALRAVTLLSHTCCRGESNGHIRLKIS